MAATATLSGCTAFGTRAFGDPMTTGATSGPAPQSNLNQPMPSQIGVQRVAAGPFIPPENVGGGGGYASQPIIGMPNSGYPAQAPMGGGSQPMSTISSQDLPVLSSTPNAPTGTQQAMPAQPSLAPAAVSPRPVQTAATTAPSALPQTGGQNVVAAPSDAYMHQIANGESLYTIARKYDVTTQALVQANGLSSPDKIVVGQRIMIPGRPDLLANKAQAAAQPVQQVASLNTPAAPAMTQPKPTMPAAPAQQATAPAQQNLAPPPAAPVQQVASAPAQQAAPAAPGASDKFRWPVSGRVVTDFAASKGTGINIEAPEGTSVKAADAGTVIYVGNGVEGYGNLVLVRHSNGFVSAYAHLKGMTVSKGDNLNRGDAIGQVGMTGSVTRPQLHFELRKGATPVDPMPHLAS